MWKNDLSRKTVNMYLKNKILSGTGYCAVEVAVASQWCNIVAVFLLGFWLFFFWVSSSNTATRTAVMNTGNKKGIIVSYTNLLKFGSFMWDPKWAVYAYSLQMKNILSAIACTSIANSFSLIQIYKIWLAHASRVIRPLVHIMLRKTKTNNKSGVKSMPTPDPSSHLWKGGWSDPDLQPTEFLRLKD